MDMSMGWTVCIRYASEGLWVWSEVYACWNVVEEEYAYKSLT